MREFRLAVILACVVSAASGCVTAGRPEAVATPPASAPPAAAPPATGGDQRPADQRSADQLARLNAEMLELQNAVARLIATSRQQDERLQYLDRRINDLANQLRGRMGSLPRGFAPTPAAPSVPAPQASTTTPTARTTPAEELYQAGVAKHRSGDLDAAVLILYDVIASYPSHPVREDAQLLVADIFYAQKEYRSAVAELEGLLNAVPGSAKIPDALLKLGLSQRALGDETRARKTWERVVSEYSNSPAARQSRTLLRGARSR